MSPCRGTDGMDLHLWPRRFASQDRLARTLSRDRAKDMASDYEQRDPAQGYAERRGISFRERVAEIVRKVVPETVRSMFDGLRPSADAAPGPDGARRPEREAPERKTANDPEATLRKARTKALVRHARAVDAIFDMQEGAARPARQMKELQEARKVFEDAAYGSHDAEAVYKKNRNLSARRLRAGQPRHPRASARNRAADRSSRRADRFVERWQKLDQPASVSIRRRHLRLQATRSAMGDMAKPERDPQLVHLANRKQARHRVESGRRLGRNWPSLTASTLAEAGASDSDPSICRLSTPRYEAEQPFASELLVQSGLEQLSRQQQGAERGCANQTVSSA
jgi:hypothetical protein